MRDHIRIGTRKSALALWQAEHISAELQRLYPNITVELVHFNTKGDRILEKPLAQVGGKGLFTAELEAAMHKGDIDIAVHRKICLQSCQKASLLGLFQPVKCLMMR